MKKLRYQLTSSTGAEIAEAAMVLPLVFMFLLGIVWFGRAFNIYSTIQQAAQQGAIAAARPTCGTCAAPGSQWGSTNFPGDTSVYNTVSAVMQASSVDPSQIPVNSNPPAPTFCPIAPPLPAAPAFPQGVCSTTNNVTICREAVLDSTVSSSQAPACGMIVSFQYPFQFYLPFTSLNFTKITLTAQAQSRMEN
jgi:Flp pilus assembly protein TadG